MNPPRCIPYAAQELWDGGVGSVAWTKAVLERVLESFPEQ